MAGGIVSAKPAGFCLLRGREEGRPVYSDAHFIGICYLVLTFCGQSDSVERCLYRFLLGAPETLQIVRFGRQEDQVLVTVTSKFVFFKENIVY